MPLIPFLHRISEREDLNSEEAGLAMESILSGQAPATQIAAFLMALRMKGETAAELAGFARAMRSMARTVDPQLGPSASLIDTCGAGGDLAGTFNISTVAAFAIAGAGVHVAKHGNRSISSRCGSADLMESLGVKIVSEPEQIGRAIREVGIGFLFAPSIHTAMKHAQAVRLELKTRTVFNLLGPLTNPAGATAQLVGAPSEKAAELMAGALAVLGLPRGFVVHGSDGLDEVTTTGPTLVYEIDHGRVERREIDPKDFGVVRAAASDLKGGGIEENRAIAMRILSGEKGPARDIVLVNASAALVASGKAANFIEGVAMAAWSIDSGEAMRKLEALVEFGHRE